eukprot:TRINITY_DN6619_c0_g1_i4.p2 TRINITY_DN6619_c0_g1~~TRINITY_DN6619_c0_g1_i4.p2  ORF type:complete len:148 (+),score=31.90 TRINITY_DN6619_c0_g1_i4:228-671(+)
MEAIAEVLTPAVGLLALVACGLVALWMKQGPGSPPIITVTAIQMPDDVEPYKRLPAQGEFTAATVPKGLLGRHNTKAGVWGQINVTKGRLELAMLEGEAEVVELGPGRNGVVAPQLFHKVLPLSEDMEMHVVFHALPDEAPCGGGFG